MKLTAIYKNSTKNYYLYEVQSPAVGKLYIPFSAFAEPPKQIEIELSAEKEKEMTL